MRVTSTALLLLSTFLFSVNGLPSGSDLVLRTEKNHAPDSQTIASYSVSGMCFQYIGQKANHDKSIAPCKAYCEKNKPDEKGYSCNGKTTEAQWKKDPSIIFQDDDGNQWVPAQCECGGPITELAEAIFNVVVEGLQMLDSIICAVMLSAFQSILEIGVMFVPGVGEEMAATRAAVQGAKSFVENGLPAADMFGNWIGKACHVPNWNFDIMDVFNPLTMMPDSLGVSIGCKKKNPLSCVKPKERPDIPKSVDIPKTIPKNDPPKTVPKTNNNPETAKDTKTDKPAPSTADKPSTTTNSKPSNTNSKSSKGTKTNATKTNDKSTKTGTSSSKTTGTETKSSTTSYSTTSSVDSSASSADSTTPPANSTTSSATSTTSFADLTTSFADLTSSFVNSTTAFANSTTSFAV